MLIEEPPIPALDAFAPGLRPTGFNILVGLPPAEGKIGSIIIPTGVGERERMGQVRGRIVAMSPAAFDFADFPEETRPQVGNAVVFAKFSGIVTEGADKQEYRLLLDKDICAVIEEKTDAV